MLYENAKFQIFWSESEGDPTKKVIMIIIVFVMATAIVIFLRVVVLI